eukprot:748601-Hanusia_phi.AAC.2
MRCKEAGHRSPPQLECRCMPQVSCCCRHVNALMSVRSPAGNRIPTLNRSGPDSTSGCFASDFCRYMLGTSWSAEMFANVVEAGRRCQKLTVSSDASATGHPSRSNSAEGATGGGTREGVATSDD